MADASLAAIAEPAKTDTDAAQRARRQPLAGRRYALEIRQHMGWRRQALILAIAPVSYTHLTLPTILLV